MIVTEFPRDLLMVSAIFGVAAFMWAGMAHERPPKQWIWRLVLIALQIAAVVLAVVGFSSALRGWDELSAFDAGGTAVIVYIVTFWVEVVAIIALSIWAYRRKRGDLIVPIILAVVGIHFIPLAWVFGQPVLVVTGVALAVISVVAVRVSDKTATRSFWCGIPAAVILLTVGTICLSAGLGA